MDNQDSRFSGGKAPVRVLLVDDSAIVRGVLRSIIEKADGLEVIGTAINGRLGVEQYKNLKPDAVLMDIEMPEMNGIDALQEILKFDSKAKVIICSSLTQTGAAMTVKALGLGAVDCLAKPSSSSVDRSSDFEEQLIIRLKAFAKNKVGGALAQKSAATTSASGGLSLKDFPQSLAISRPQVIAIGSSTGGPKALTAVLSNLNTNIDLPPILITQHMPAGFTKMLAESLGKASGLTACEAQDDMLIKPKTIYVAPGGRHFTVEKRMAGVFVALSDGPQVNYCKPAVDVMMDGVLETYQSGILSVILTGMGSDGVDSCTKVVEANDKNLLLAQDEASSVVWGMPAAVAKAGICHAVLPLDDIAPAINKLLIGQRP